MPFLVPEVVICLPNMQKEETLVLDLGDGLNACHAHCEHPELDDCRLVIVGNRAAAKASYLNQRLGLNTPSARVYRDGDGGMLNVNEEQAEGKTREWVVDQTREMFGKLQEVIETGEKRSFLVAPFSAYFTSISCYPLKTLGEDGAPKHLEMFFHGQYESDRLEEGECVIFPMNRICVEMEDAQEGSFPEELAWLAPRVLAMDSATRQLFDEKLVRGRPEFVRGDKDRPWLVTHCKLAVPNEYFEEYMRSVQSLERPLLDASIADMNLGDRVAVRD